MLTSSDYNYEFGNAIRNKRRNEKILSEGYDKGSDSYMFPSGSFNDFSDAVVKENLFRRLGTVLHAPTKEGLIQTVFSTANVFFASTFWTKLQNIFGHCCKTLLDIVACPNWTKLQ